MRQNRRLPGLVLTLMLVLASMATGLGYSYARAATDPALIAYAEAGGSLDDLCLGSGGASHRGIPCDCCLTGPALIPDPVALPHPVGYVLALAPLFSATPALPDTPRDPVRAVRGPPAAV